MHESKSFVYICAQLPMHIPVIQTLITTQNTIITQKVPSCPLPVILHHHLSRGNHSSDSLLPLMDFPVFNLYLNGTAMV